MAKRNDEPLKAVAYHEARVVCYHADSRDVLKVLPDNSLDSIATDPPYALVSIVKRFGADNAAPAKDWSNKPNGNPYTRASAGFMGQRWDVGDVAFDPDFWREVFRVVKPGGHVAAFGGTRTYHRLAVAIEDAGFEIRDALQWIYGSGFPKSHDVSKGIDKATGAEREVVGVSDNSRPSQQRSARGFDKALGSEALGGITLTAPATDAAREWQGWGTALKPACEIICLARKPLSEGTVAANVLRWGTGALNIDACRVEAERATGWQGSAAGGGTWNGENMGLGKDGDARPVQGRWPANLLHDGSPEVLAGFPDAGGGFGKRGNNKNSTSYGFEVGSMETVGYGDSGSAARFFYTAKADAHGRVGSKHPTVKPVDLMQWLVRLITPRGGVTLDPFAGSGTTGEAALLEGFRAILCEREPQYQADIAQRMAHVFSGKVGRSHVVNKDKAERADKENPLPLFGGES